MAVNHLFQRAEDFESRAISPRVEFGAYEALWAREGMSFKKLAEMFRDQSGTVPSDFVPRNEAEQYSRLALAEINKAGIARFGVRVNGAGEYPPKLRDAAHPVELLYFRGNWDITSLRSIAIVGTRNPSPEGLKRATKLARLFTQQGFCVVSGLAKGVDTAAHSAAIETGGQTIAVLGTPITATYPAENAELQRRIAEDYLVISQVPIVRYSRQTPHGNKLFFPERNITMSALTEATVIVEAGNTSGTLIQARNALQQGRKLFILESCFNNRELTWPADYEAKGGIRVADFGDIIKHLAGDSDAGPSGSLHEN